MQILASDVDFWTRYDFETMKLLHDSMLYPPHTTIQAHCRNNQSGTIILKVKGARNRHTLRVSKQFGSLPAHVHVPEVAVADEPLQLDPHLSILYTILCKSVAPQWEHVGIFLGVKLPTIDRIRRENDKDVYACFRELIKAWLRQINPPATKSKILHVLREVELNEEADKLQKHWGTIY